MKISKSQRNNIIFLGVILLLIIPQTRQPIQVLLHKGLALFGTSVIEESERKTIVFEDWQLEDLNGNSYNFKESEGQVVFLNFWATWCPPCIAEMPSLQDLYTDYKDKVNFIFVSNEEQQVVKKFLDRKGYNIQVFSPKSNSPEAFNIQSIPHTFLIDRKGNIVIDKKGAVNWNSDAIRAQLNLLLSN